MAGKIPDLHATVRTGTGKGAARQARRNGDVPGIIYGGGTDPVAINLSFNPLLARLRKGRFLSTLFNMKVDGHEDTRVICRAVQRDVVKDLPVHVDFMRLKQNSRVKLFIHVNFDNEAACPGIKKGGVLTVVRNEVELDVLAGDIPDHITVDLTGLELGDVIHINDVELPSGAKSVIERNFVIANISAPSGLRSSGGDDEDDEEEAEEEADAE
jgi:large subunit ribosomal protein L25